jgi:thiol-disulfide isomerase/thioredoxin
MAKLTRPVMTTLLLSAAAMVGYIGYRFLPPAPDGAEEADAIAAQSAPPLADHLPDFSLSDLNGNPVAIGTWQGRPMIVNFWATWCAPCLREIPLLKAFQDEHEGVQVIGIAVDSPEPVGSFAEEMAFNYPILVGQNDAMVAATSFGIQVLALPITVFTDSAGAILGIHTGELHQEHLDNFAGTIVDLENGRADLAAARARLAGRM